MILPVEDTGDSFVVDSGYIPDIVLMVVDNFADAVDGVDSLGSVDLQDIHTPGEVEVELE